MCLYKVNERLAGRGTKIYTGWKIFEKSSVNTRNVIITGFEYCFRYYSHEGGQAVPVNQWLKAAEGSIGSDNGAGARYDSGFHIYKYPYPARYMEKTWNHLVAVKVKYRKVVARGRESDDAVIVAREMYVPYQKPGRTQNVNKKKK